MERKLQRIILDLEDLVDERYINSEAKERIKDAVRILQATAIYSTEFE